MKAVLHVLFFGYNTHCSFYLILYLYNFKLLHHTRFWRYIISIHYTSIKDTLSFSIKYILYIEMSAGIFFCHLLSFTGSCPVIFLTISCSFYKAFFPEKKISVPSKMWRRPLIVSVLGFCMLGKICRFLSQLYQDDSTLLLSGTMSFEGILLIM